MAVASDSLDLIITSDIRDFPYEKKYPSAMKLVELKKKLELVVGTRGECMAIELRDKFGKFLSTLSDDSAQLGSLGIQTGMKIHVTDVTGNAATYSDDVSAVPKFTLPDDSYNQREDSLRAWKRREGLNNPNMQQKLAEYEKAASCFKLGDRCIVKVANNPEKRGIISFIGLTKFKPGHWIGVTYDEPIGKNDGSVDGETYFKCAKMCGAFVRPHDVVLDADDDENMEEI